MMAAVTNAHGKVHACSGARFVCGSIDCVMITMFLGKRQVQIKWKKKLELACENMALKMASAASGALFLTGCFPLSSTITLHATATDEHRRTMDHMS
jgi:hypothetical protein